MSKRELDILETLYGFEAKMSEEASSKVEAIFQYWPSFEETIERDYSIRPEELPDVMTRLERTSLYTVLKGRALGDPEGKGHLTHTYAKFRAAIYRSKERVDK
ncbi:MAG: hypothetical protein HQK87_11880 [Nitrospinae bacterium]|nr:hypothetical protein [Nitrospinota bacterium]